MFAQSNLAFLKAISAEFGYTGYIYTCSEAVDCNEGKYSKGELRQMLNFVGRAASGVATEL